MLKILIICVVVYFLIVVVLFFVQEKLIFFPEKLDKHYQFTFSQRFEEVNIRARDGVLLNGVLFRSASPRGLVLYLHGNAGSVNTWGEVAKTYTDLGYDVFIPDYRGYGKSAGYISSEKQVFDDMQTVYNAMKANYPEDKIVILGYSIGTGPAAQLASVNHPRLLILQAPYFSLVDMMRHTYPIIPTFILKYKFETNKYIKLCTMPVVLFHGTKDEVIYYGSSVKLSKLLKSGDRLVTLHDLGHNGMTFEQQYISVLQQILGR